jgi:hypothetical protein
MAIEERAAVLEVAGNTSDILDQVRELLDGADADAAQDAGD